MGSAEKIFREGAIETAASPDQLNAIAPLVTPRHVLLLASVFLLAGILIGWACFASIPITVTGPALIKHDAQGKAIGCVAFFSLSEGKRIDVGQVAFVAVSTVAEDEHGVVVGRVDTVDERLTSLETVTELAGDPTLAQEIQKQLGTTLFASIVFDSVDGRLRWQGGVMPADDDLKLFTPCEVRVVIDDKSPIQLLLPTLFTDRVAAGSGAN
ncbi:MAG: hypothetical protein FJ254_00960 [Phycisphaerae bacterium]|nr:hypothetical protein [Phycisphaerae bacterium]